MKMKEIPTKAIKQLHRYISIEEAWYEDNGFATYENDRLRAIVAKALSKIPTRLAEKAYSEISYICENEDNASYIYLYKNSFLKGRKAIVIFDRGLFDFDEKKQIRLVLHETAHHLLNHRVFLFAKDEKEHKENNETYDRQETEAWEKVDLWLKEYEDWSINIKPGAEKEFQGFRK